MNKKMTFGEFADTVVSQIREYLPKNLANDAEIQLNSVNKNNNIQLTGLIVRSLDSNISPTIYLEEFYKKYQDGEAMDQLLSQIARIRIENEVTSTFDTEQITDFSRIRDDIVPRLINATWNSQLLQERPHRMISDLAVTFHILLKQDFSEQASIPVTNALVSLWGVDDDVLYYTAINNMIRLQPSEFIPMQTLLLSMMGDLEDFGGVPDSDCAMYVLTNQQRNFGAAALLDEKRMQEVLRQVDEKIYVIPCSVHELIIIPASTERSDPTALKEMIHDVNYSQVSPQERLSDHLYSYSETEGLQIVC